MLNSSVNYSLFEMKGADARDFLHRLTTVDVRNLSPGKTATGFFLEPTGRIRAFFHILCESQDRFLLVTPRGQNDTWKSQLLAVIEQFTFAEKYELAERHDLVALESDRPEGSQSLALNQELFLNLVPATPAAQGDAINEHDREKRRILALYPKVDAELTPSVNPLEIGLQHGIADQKGCYPGQEVIEKILSLGAPARRLVLLTGKGTAPRAGEKLTGDSGAECGEITSATQEGDLALALALVRKTQAKPDSVLRTLSGLDLKISKISPYETHS